VSARAPRRKPSGKAKKSPSDPIPDHDAKAAEGIPAHKEAKFAPLPWAHSISAPEELWGDFERMARNVLTHFESAPETLDSDRLMFVMYVCFFMLRENSKLGNGKAREAIKVLLIETRCGCKFLADAATHEKSRAVLKAHASRQSKWPVMLSPEKDSFKAAKDFLGQIGVGKTSILPTAKMKAAAEKRWRELAAMLIEKIEFSRILLGKQAGKEKSTSPFVQWQIDMTELPDALKWKQVLNLPPRRNKQTSSKWWEVAGKMLKAHWGAHPAEKKADFEKVKISAPRAGETPEAYAFRQVRIIFHKLAAKGDKGNDGS